MFEKLLTKKFLGASSLLIATGILICTLWPFQPFPANQVSWLEGSDGIRFDWAGVVLSSQPLPQASDSVADSGSASLEIWLKPSNTNDVSTVLDFYEPGNSFRFQIRQYLGGLIVSRDSRTLDGKLKRAKIDLAHGLQKDKLILVTLSSSPAGTSLYLDGELKGGYPNFRFASRDFGGQIILGTSPVDSQPWTGEIRGLAVYGDALTPLVVQKHYQDWIETGLPVSQGELPTSASAIYTFHERQGSTIHAAERNAPDLEIPAHFSVPHQAFLKTPSAAFEASWPYFADALSNIVGFLPLGVCLCGYLAFTRPLRWAILLTVIMGFIYSLGIESLQAFLPQRVSDFTDVLTNTLGTAWGALLAGSLKNQELLGGSKG
jgi:VanZ like protein/concanavalin A-like lectin/glucanase superfamily protein